MIHGITRRRALAAGAAAGLLGRPGGLLAEPGLRGVPDRLGWDDLAQSLDRPVRIAGFLHAGPDGDGTAALLPCLAPVLPPPDQWLLLAGDALPRVPTDILVLEATGRIETQDAGRIEAHEPRYTIAPETLRLLLRL